MLASDVVMRPSDLMNCHCHAVIPLGADTTAGSLGEGTYTVLQRK